MLDWRTTLKIVLQSNPLAVTFVTNMRDEKDRKIFLGKWRPPRGHFNGPRYWIMGVAGRTRALDVIADDLNTPEGRSKARTMFVSAVEWAKSKGANVVLFAAGTKRLFENRFQELQNQFPHIVFTIGDNGTFLLLKEETVRALETSGLKPMSSRICIIGPYGFLGELMTKTLVKLGHNVVGVGPNREGLEKVSQKYGIEVFQEIKHVGFVDACIACTHSEKVRVTSENVELLRKEDRKLLVVDVAEPSNLTYKEYKKCQDRVVRQDAGNAYSSKLKYVLGAVSYRMFRLTRGVTFGCFAETLALGWAMRHGLEKEVRRRNFLEVSEENMKFVADLFVKIGFTIPSPRCFSKPVKSFELKMIPFQETRTVNLSLGKSVGLFLKKKIGAIQNN